MEFKIDSRRSTYLPPQPLKLDSWNAPEASAPSHTWAQPPRPPSHLPDGHLSAPVLPPMASLPTTLPVGAANPNHQQQNPAAFTTSREAANIHAVQNYLALRQQFYTNAAVAPTAPVAAQVPAPIANPLTRRSKRVKPMARRSLQALFDAAAASDTSTWAPSGSSVDTEDEFDTASGSAASSQTEIGRLSNCSSCNICTPLNAAGSIGPNTPPANDSALPVARSFEACTSTEAIAASSTVPLQTLLSAPRGSALTLLEAKAIVYRLAEDLNALHSANIVHRRVCLNAAQLTFANDHYAAAALPAGTAAVRLSPGTASYIAPREPSMEPYLAPEALSCHSDRTVHTVQGDMWSLGVTIYLLLTGSTELPLCTATLQSKRGTVDDVQAYITRQLTQALRIHHNAFATPSSEAHVNTSKVCIDEQSTALLTALLQADPAQRLTALEVLEHSWLADIVDLLPKNASSVAAAFASASIVQDSSPAAVSPPVSPPARPVTEQQQQPASTQQSDCPYPLIGHVARPVEIKDADGNVTTMSALHAVYEVPGKGAMMSANPVSLLPVESVESAIAAQQQRQQQEHNNTTTSDKSSDADNEGNNKQQSIFMPLFDMLLGGGGGR